MYRLDTSLGYVVVGHDAGSEMAGETDLATLLAGMSPHLDDAEWMFVTLTKEDAQPLMPLAIASFREEEGMTLVLPRSAGSDLGQAIGPMMRITLEIHSSLEAVGLTAAVAGALAADGISANVIAAYYHDHIFVPSASADRALAILHKLSNSEC